MKRNKNRDKVIAALSLEPLVNEQFKSIRTSISFASIDRHVQTLLITSSESGSGKSTISANLSIAYAQQGKKTVLIDCDLRKPTVHRAFYVNGFVGLSSVLMDQLNVIEACQKTKIENLSVLASGVVPPNPNDLLGSKKMKLILEHLKKNLT